jgi:hypothetical protein
VKERLEIEQLKRPYVHTVCFKNGSMNLPATIKNMTPGQMFKVHPAFKNLRDRALASARRAGLKVEAIYYPAVQSLTVECLRRVAPKWYRRPYNSDRPISRSRCLRNWKQFQKEIDIFS